MKTDRIAPAGAGMTAVSPGASDPVPVLDVRELSKEFGVKAARREILQKVTLQVTRGQFVSVVGPSGAGKTTFLRCLAGLAPPSSGSVFLDGSLVTGPPAQVAVVFQDYSRSLLPWLRVRDNVALPLRGKGARRSEIMARADEALATVGLLDAADRYPWQLSGGMQQRVAIARALACKPALLLMDEPFASVDAQTRLELEDLIHDVHADQAMTTLLVTHDIDEAVYLSDQVIVLSRSPARLVDVIKIELGDARDQLTTRSLPEFTEYRARVLTHIHASKRKGVA